MAVKNKLLAIITLALLGGACSLEGDIETVLNGIAVPEKGLAKKLEWIRENPESNKTYLVAVNDNEELDPQTFSYPPTYIPPSFSLAPSVKNITIWLQGTGGEKIIRLKSRGSMFTIGEGVKLVLDKNITLQGHNANYNNPLITINNGGNLVMNAGAKITGNSYDGVRVYNGGTFVMEGGEISGNSGAGVSYSPGTFTPKGGQVFGNSGGNKVPRIY
jgi:hypothetical protein